MRSIDLETFHHRIKNTIQTTASYSYLQKPKFPQLVRSCRLKPYSCFAQGGKCKKLEYLWVDEFNNSLNLQNRQFQIIYNDPQIKCQTNIKTDLFYGYSIEQVMSISKVVIINQNQVLFYGRDEYFRCFEIKDNIKISGLNCGIDNLFWILENIDKKYAYTDQDLNWGLYQLPNLEIETMIRKDYIDNG